MTKDFYDKVYNLGHPSGYDGGVLGMPDRAKMLWKRTDEWLLFTGLKNNTESKILEIGSGMSYLSKIHSGWHGAEYSKSAVERVKKRDGAETPIFEEDAQCLTFADKSFDGVFSWAALEHVPDPNLAFEEIHRILKGGGVRIDCASVEL